MPVRSSVWPIIIILTLFAGCSSSNRSTPGRNAGYNRPADVRVTGNRKTIINESKKWLGTPYCYGGIDGECFDCSGFVSRVFLSVGFKLPRSARDMYDAGSAVSMSNIQPADLVFFKNTAGPGISHVGIFLGGRQFIHASSSRGVITTSLDDEYYVRHFAGVRKMLR